jgi:Predicted GTPase, probable translation factor
VGLRYYREAPPAPHPGLTGERAGADRASAEALAGLSISAEDIRSAIDTTNVDLFKADADALCRFSDALVLINKPMVVLLNKADMATDEMLKPLPPEMIRATAAGELALRNAAAAGLIRYLPGDSDFTES